MTECVICDQRVCGHDAKAVLCARFHAVVLGAGYLEPAATSIVEEWFPRYIGNVPEFVKKEKAQ